MNTIVKEVLKKEEMMRKNLEAQLLQERETIAMNMIAETNEVVEALGCKHLIATNNNTVVTNVTINKGKIVEKIVKVEVPVVKEIIKEVPGPIQVVQDMTEIEKHLDTIAAQKKEIERLREELAKKEAKDTVENTVKEVLSKRTKRVKTSVTDMINNAPDVEDIAVKIEIEQPKVTTEKEVTVIKTDVNMKSKHVGLYQTDRCFLIASSRNENITWLSNVILTDEYKKQIEEKLVNEHGLMKSRVKTSPVIIEKDNAYMARVEAVNINGNHFSTEDKLSGFVKIDKEFYLYTYKPSMGRAYIDSLTLKLVGEFAQPSADIDAKVQEIIKGLYQEYKAECEKLLNTEQQTKVNALLAREARRAARRQQHEAFNKPSINTKPAQDTNQAVNNTIDSTETITVKSRELQKYVDLF